MSISSLERKCFDNACWELLKSAEGFAELTDFRRIHPSHLFLAMLKQSGGFLDQQLALHCDGLKAATVGDSLQEILELNPPPDDIEEGAGDLFQLPCEASTWQVLSLAQKLAREWGAETISLPALACAALNSVDPYSREAFADARVSPKNLGELAALIASQESTKVDGGTAGSKLAPFAGDLVCLESFGEVASDALLTLTQMGEGRPLLAEDLFIAFLSHERSRTAEALHVMGLSPKSIARGFTQRYGEVRGAKGRELEQSRMGRMLRSIVNSAEQLARRENSPVIGESHLIRAYIDRTCGDSGNILQQLGINPVRLAEYLAKYKVDRKSAPAAREGAPLVQDMEGYLCQRVVGQEEAIRAVVPALRRMRLGVNEAGRPLGVFLFLGATGVGKTELAKGIADIAFGPKPGVRDPYLIRVDCGKLTDSRDIVQLVGAPQGLVGYKEGHLTNGLRDKGNRCIVLFDEAEKAHPKVWQSLLTFFDEGIVTEADGTLYDATGCILIATSNLGYKEAIDNFRLFDLSSAELDRIRPQLQALIWKRVEEYFSPEFRGRFGRQNVLFFNNFRREHYQAMIAAQIQATVDEMAQRGIEIVVEPAVHEILLEMAWEGRQHGARDVRRLVTQHVRDRFVDAQFADPALRRLELGVSDEMRSYQQRHAAQHGTAMERVDLEAFLKDRVVSQDHSIHAILPTLKRLRAGLNEPGRLMGVFLFLGATGVGKTELARAIADVAFGQKSGIRDAHLILINCGVLKEPRDIVQLLGAPQGLKGYKEGALTNGLRDKGNRCVILFDEAEKAHPQVWQSLLQLFDEGIVMEADGTQYDATGCILVATSNLGYSDAIEKFRLYERPPAELEQLRSKVEDFIWTRVSEYFSPEFRGRFGRENVLFFNHFTLAAYRDMLERQAAVLITEMRERGIALIIDGPVFDALADLAWDKRAEGARPVRRLMTQFVRDQVVAARAVDSKCASVRVSLTGDLARAHATRQAEKRAAAVDDVEAYLNARVINQPHAVRLLVPAVKRMRMSMNEAGRLIGSYLFLGPSGVGKTELAKATADAAFGAHPGSIDPHLIRIDCGKLTDSRDIVQLLGAPQGLVGYKEGVLTNGLRDKGGRCVIIFDEAEKADPHIWQSLLTFFDEGIVTEADGTRYDATGCILVATSNLGYKEAISAFRLFEIRPEDAQALRPQVEEFVWQKVNAYFSPEFLGRFGRENVVLFNHFGRADYRAIIAIQVAALNSEMEARGLKCPVEDTVVDKLVDLAWERRSEGARTVRRLVTAYLRDQIVDGLGVDPQRTVFHFCINADREIAARDR